MFDFDMLDLAPALGEALARAGFSTPTPIQNQAIPLALEGRDILGLAQTGSGKTLAFGLPLVHHLLGEGTRPAPRTAPALILAPTRELAGQIADSVRGLTERTHLGVVTVVGGQSIRRQIDRLARGTHILVATPGRLIDLMERGAVDLGAVRFLVLDEADQMLDMGFIHALRRIVPALGKPRQTMLFSATMSPNMEEIAGAYLDRPHRVQVDAPGRAADRVSQSVHFMERGDKPTRLRELLERDAGARTLVFARTKHGAEKLMKSLRADGFNAASIHGNKSQSQRDRAITAFRSGSVSILVATDVAARGIDIPDVACVINYDLPNVAESYVHRIGRTARAGRAGEAIAFCTREEAALLRQIQKVLGAEIPVGSGENLLEAFPQRRAAANGEGRGPSRAGGPRLRRPGRGRRPGGNALHG